MKLGIRIGELDISGPFLEPAPCCRRQGRQNATAGFPCVVCQLRRLDRLFQHHEKMAIPRALQPSLERLRSDLMARTERAKKGCHRIRFVSQLVCGRFLKPRRENVQIADGAEQICKPLELFLERPTPLRLDQVSKGAQLTAQPPGRSAQTVNSFAIAAPGVWIALANPEHGTFECRLDGSPYRISCLDLRLKSDSWSVIRAQRSGSVRFSTPLSRVVVRHHPLRESAASLCRGMRKSAHAGPQAAITAAMASLDRVQLIGAGHADQAASAS